MEKTTREQILVVDDDPQVCGVLADALEAEGYQPITCSHPNEALAVADREAFDLAFVDINLPEMSGLELAKRLKDQDPPREVVIVTGYCSFDNALQAIKIGAYDYLGKPFSISELNLCLNRFQERRALREQARLAEQRYFHLVENMPLLIFVLNKDYVLDFVNDACSAMLGFTPQEALNTPGWFLDRIHPLDRERVRKPFDSAFNSGGGAFSVESRIIHKKGHLIHALLRSIPRSWDENGLELDQLEGIIVDITDRVFLEKALVQKEKLKTLGAVSAEVAHEIRNPLVAIGGFARRLQKKVPDLTEGTIILNESRRLENILDRIRHYLKPVDILPQECSMNNMITYCVDLLSPEMERNQIACHLDLDPGLSIINVDPQIVTRAFINLIRNAIRAMEGRGAIFIRSFESDRNLYVEFKNKVQQKKIRDPEHLLLPFDEDGQSLGMPLCYKLLKNMGGLLSFEQEQDYMVFIVSLPKEVTQIKGD